MPDGRSTTAQSRDALLTLNWCYV